jgi:hypothetical protein
VETLYRRQQTFPVENHVNKLSFPFSWNSPIKKLYFESFDGLFGFQNIDQVRKIEHLAIEIQRWPEIGSKEDWIVELLTFFPGLSTLTLVVHHYEDTYLEHKFPEITVLLKDAVLWKTPTKFASLLRLML